MTQKTTVLGVDIGGSHITAALIDLETGNLQKSSLTRAAVDSRKEKEEILTAWCAVITEAFGDDLSTKQIGIAMPGPFDYENGISLIKEQDKFNALYLLNIKEELAKRLAVSPENIRFINDAAGFLQGELFSGAAKGYSNVLGLTLGTGLGAALSVDAIANDAELWCAPFKEGIAEDYLSTKWFLKRYLEITGETLTGVKELATKVDAYPFSKQIFDEFGSSLGDFLAPIIRENNTEVVILGGNIAQALPLFSPTLMQKLEREQLKTAIKLSTLNEHAALIGAASKFDFIVK